MLTVLKWIGTGSGALGALLIALNIPESGWAFAFFLVSSIAWFIAGLQMRDRALWMLNLVFIGIDTLGIVRWLF
jgi:hypothetical protein